jgi:two-component system NtrC family sensor kinase
MSVALGSATNWVQQFAVTESLAERASVLVLLAAAVLLFRTFRERYVLFWLVGWFWFLIYRVAGYAGEMHGHPFAAASSHAAFVLSVAFVVGGVAEYTSVGHRMKTIGVIALVSVVAVVARVLIWPDSRWAMLLVHALYMVMTVGAAVQLALFNRGRRDGGPWLMIPVLLLLHLDEGAGNAHALAGIDLTIETMLGVGMVTIVLDEARARTGRLRAIRAIATAIARGQDSAPMMMSSLRELSRLYQARAAWFRVLEDGQLVLQHHLGLSDEFVEISARMPVATSFGGVVIREGRLAVVAARHSTHEGTRDRLLHEGYDHVIIVPVKGKNSILGTLGLGCSVRRAYRDEETTFLETTANQIGIALENLRMIEQVRLSQQQWASTFDSIQDCVLVHDAENRIIKANRALLRRLGRGPEQIVNERCETVLPPSANGWKGCPYCALPPLVDAADPCFSGFSLVSTSSYREHGNARAGTIHIIRDTTQNRAAEENYRVLFEQVQEGVFISTPEGRLLECNEGLVRMLGYSSREEMLGIHASELFVDAAQRQVLQKEIEARGFVRNYELKLRRKDGSAIEAIENSIGTRGASGRIEKYQGFLLDVTEKKRVEDEIRRHNRELNALNAIAVVATQSFDLDEILNATLRQVAELLAAEVGGVWLYDNEQKSVRRRAAIGHRTGLGSSFGVGEGPDSFWEWVERTRAELVTEETMPPAPAVIKQFIAAEDLRCWICVVLWSKDKPVGVFCVSSRSSREFSERDKHLLIAIGRQLATTIEKVRLYDETCRAYDHLRRTQEQLLQSEKMSAVGQLISGVAHELNNPLTAILGYAQLLEGQDLGEQARDFVQKLFRQAQRTQRIVQNLLSFARQRKPTKGQVNLERVVEEALALRDYDLKLSNITVERQYQAGLPPVVADGHQMEQVFLNIINNAVDALLEGGGNGGVLRVRIFGAEGSVCTEFWDSGPGVVDTKRIFDPFYTTKKVGKGTGLGLSICYGIVKEHGGEIVARNHPEGGAVFEVRLPAAMAIRKLEPEAARPAPEAGLRGKVLLVDDEEAVLDFERKALTEVGLQVEAATTADEGIARLEEEDFDLVVVDGKMPGGQTGMAVYRWAARHRPGLEKRIVFTLSDGVNDSDTRAFLQETNAFSLLKPFEIGELIGLARKVLERAKAAAQG